MTFAHRLAQQGYEVSIFESSDNLGGLTASWKIADITWDKFYHVILLSDQNLRSLLEELGLDDKIKWQQTKTGFYVNNKFYSMSNSLEFLKFSLLSIFDKLRLGLTIFYASKIKNWKSLENILVEKWLRKWSGNNTFEKIWQPLLRAKLGEQYKVTSAAFIWATIQRMYAARRGGMKTEMFGYVPGGYAVILDKFKLKLISENVKIFTNHTAGKIEWVNNKAEVQFENGISKQFDKIIVTIPSNKASKICSALTDHEKKELNDVKYLGVICASVILKEQIGEYYVTNIIDKNIPFTGIINMSALVDPKEFKGKILIYLPRYLNADDDEFLLSDDELKKKFTKALLEMYSMMKIDDIIEMQIARAKEVFSLPTLGYSNHLPDKSVSASGVYIINSSHIVNGTLNNNEVVKLVDTCINEIQKRF